MKPDGYELCLPLRVMYSPVAPMWYFTSPEPRTLRGSTSSKPAKISSGDRLGDVGDDVEASTMAHAHYEFGGAEAGAGVENSSTNGISAVTPSSEKRLLPR